MSNILITGATGFIGAAVARSYLQQGSTVHALLRARSDLQLLPAGVQVHRADSMEELDAVMAEVKPDCVLHLASLFLVEHDSPQAGELVASNILFGTWLLEAMAHHGVRRFINTGTSWQHFGSSSYRPVNLYAATKQAFEDVAAYYSDVHGIACITLKLFDTYGPGDRRRKLIRILLDAAQSQQVLDMSPGEQLLDMTYIDDVVRAYHCAEMLLASAQGPQLADYLVSGSRHSLREVVAIVAEVTGKPMQVSFGGRPYRSREVMVPVQDAGKLLPGWTPEYDLRAGLAKMIS